MELDISNLNTIQWGWEIPVKLMMNTFDMTVRCFFDAVYLLPDFEFFFYFGRISKQQGIFMGMKSTNIFYYVMLIFYIHIINYKTGLNNYYLRAEL